MYNFHARHNMVRDLSVEMVILYLCIDVSVF